MLAFVFPLPGMPFYIVVIFTFLQIIYGLMGDI